MTEANRQYYKKLGERLRLLRLEKGLTLAQLAVATKLGEEQILQLQSGDMFFNNKIVGLVAKALGMKKSEFSEDFQDAQ